MLHHQSMLSLPPHKRSKRSAHSIADTDVVPPNPKRPRRAIQEPILYAPLEPSIASGPAGFPVKVFLFEVFK